MTAGPAAGLGPTIHPPETPCPGEAVHSPRRLGYPRARRPKWRNWQTRTTQNRVPVRVCGFDSHLRHHSIPNFVNLRSVFLPARCSAVLPVHDKERRLAHVTSMHFFDHDPAGGDLSKRRNQIASAVWTTPVGGFWEEAPARRYRRAALLLGENTERSAGMGRARHHPVADSAGRWCHLRDSACRRDRPVDRSRGWNATPRCSSSGRRPTIGRLDAPVRCAEPCLRRASWAAIEAGSSSSGSHADKALQDNGHRGNSPVTGPTHTFSVRAAFLMTNHGVGSAGNVRAARGWQLSGENSRGRDGELR